MKRSIEDILGADNHIVVQHIGRMTIQGTPGYVSETMRKLRKPYEEAAEQHFGYYNP